MDSVGASAIFEPLNSGKGKNRRDTETQSRRREDFFSAPTKSSGIRNFEKRYMSLKLRLLLLCLLSGLVASAVWFPTASGAVEFSKAAWLEDYQALKRFLESGYANLDSARQAKNVDLVALDAKTRQSLERATSDGEAKEILKRFLQAFDDLHLKLGEVDKPATENQPDPALSLSASGAEVCKSLGFRERSNRFSLAFDAVPGFQMVSTDKDVFAMAILQLDNSRRFGLLRLTLFSPDAFPKVCETGWEEFRRTLKADCDGACRWRFYAFVHNRLTETLAAQVKALQARQIAGLIVDIAGNGGGTEWADSVARLLAAKPLKSPRQGSVRHARDIARFELQLQLIESDLKRNQVNAEQRKLLTQAQERIAAALHEARTASPCERPDIWTSPAGGKNCSSLKTVPSFSSGVFDYAPRHLLAGLEAKSALFNPSYYQYQESVFNGPLFVLLDRKTASASEYFAALLQDNGAAQILGERTLGVGCGYTNGGIKWVLPNSRLRVWMPDCIRYRKDGSNEYEGVMPDSAIWTKDDDKSARLEKLLRVLREMR